MRLDMKNYLSCQLAFADDVPVYETAYFLDGVVFDFAWPDIKLGVHVTNRNHDYKPAMRQGWNIYRCDNVTIKSGQALSSIQTLILLAELKDAD